MGKRLMRYVFATCCLLAGSAQCQAGVVSFGSGANQFNMEFVTIGNPGNAADTRSTSRPISATLGSVGYTYGIGKFEVSEDMITKYNANFGTANGLVITKDTRDSNKPATSVSWNEAARFVNWLNTSTGGFAAYKYTTNGVNDDIALWTASDTLDYDASNPYRSKRATYVLPSYNEWYKAAYHSPSGTYYDFANGSDTRPTAVTGGLSGAVYTQSGEASPTGPADIDQAGGLSPYGVMGLGGNVFEWEESSFNLSNNSGSSSRGIRGGDWLSVIPNVLSLSIRGNIGSSIENDKFGFRVASLSSSAPPAVPEPSMMVIGTLFGLGGLVAKRRMKK
jgi:hypothetical protein